MTDYELVVSFVPVDEIEEVRLTTNCLHAHVRIDDPSFEKVIEVGQGFIEYLHEKIWPEHSRMALATKLHQQALAALDTGSKS